MKLKPSIIVFYFFRKNLELSLTQNSIQFCYLKYKSGCNKFEHKSPSIFLNLYNFEQRSLRSFWIYIATCALNLKFI